jgi:hypothetical protein
MDPTSNPIKRSIWWHYGQSRCRNPNINTKASFRSHFLKFTYNNYDNYTHYRKNKNYNNYNNS